MWDEDSPFCNSSFWDSDLLWNNPDPEFTLCFEKTVLVWVPCLSLWILSPLEVYYIFQSKCRYVPWGFLNTCKLLMNLLLIFLSASSLVRSLVIYFTSGDVYPVDIWTPVVQIATFTLALVFLLWNKLRGLQTSGVLFVFWLLLTVAGIPQFRSEIRHESRGELEDSMFGFITYMIYYPVVVLIFLFNFFSDKPRKTNYARSKNMCPEIEASFASRLIFRWLDSLVWNGYRRPLTIEDLWELRHQDKSSQITPQFQKCWEKQLGVGHVDENGVLKSYGTMGNSRNRVKKQVNVLRPIFRTFWKLFAAGGTCRVIGDLFSFASPQILSLMMKFVSSDEFMWRGIVYAVGLFLASEMQTFFYHHNLMTMSVLGLNIRTAVISAIYRKSLRISSAARRESPIGEVVNLMAVDAQRFIDFSAYFNLIYAAPIVITLAMYFLWELLGPSALAGLAIMVILVPINITIANSVKSLQMKQMKYKDERVKLMNEVLSGVKVLKLYAWEPSFEQQIRRIRENEVTMLRKAALLNASISFLWACSPFLVSLATFGVYVMSDETHVLTAEVAFVAASLFNLMKNPINMFPQAVQILVQTLVSTKRINRFLNAEELDIHSVSHDENQSKSGLICKK